MPLRLRKKWHRRPPTALYVSLSVSLDLIMLHFASINSPPRSLKVTQIKSAFFYMHSALDMRSFPLLLLFPLLTVVGCSAAADAVTVKTPSRVRFDTGGLSREAFPAGFVFGTAASAYQVEGMALKDGRGPSIWDAFVKIPGEIANNGTADVTVDEYHRYKEDVDIMRKMNFDAYRFSISWSRIFPNGVGKVNWEGVAYYNRLINYMLKKGVTPYANLYHYDLPEALEKQYNGLLSPKVV